jgi:predicted RNase H-like HicB family nuclease
MAAKRAQVQIRSYSYRVIVEEDAFPDGAKAYHAYVPALKSCRSWGYTIEEALKNVQEAAEVWIEDALKHGELVPKRDP